MDYRAAARYRATRLTDLISEEMLSGKGLIKSSAKAISAKTKASFKGIQQNLDPLNIASALMGRSRLGTTITGKMFGRSAEDISYFSGDRGRSARPIRKYRYKNPLIATVGSGDTQPAKRNDGLANIFGKIYNTMMKNREEEKKRKEIENNFKKENMSEDERRHKELIAAIVKGRGSKIQKVEKKDDGGGIFGLLKGIFDKVMEFVKPIIDFFDTILKPLSGLFNFLKGLAGSALNLLIRVFGILAGPEAFMGLLLLGGVAAIAKLGEMIWDFVRMSDKERAAAFKKAKGETDAKTGKVDVTKEQGKQMTDQASKKYKGLYIAEKVEKDPKEKARLQKILKRESDRIGKQGYDISYVNAEAEKEYAALVKNPKNLNNYVMRAKAQWEGDAGEGPKAEPAKQTPPAAAPSPSPAPAGAPGAAGSPGAAGAPGAADASSTQTSSPVSPKPSPVAAASTENSNLQIEEKTTGGSSAPVVVNNTTSTGVEAKKNDGVPPVPAAVRNLDLDDPLISNLKRVAYQ
jgi:hypothetical protein